MKMKKAALLSVTVLISLACDDASNPVATSVPQPVVVAAAAASSPSEPVPAPADAVEGATCKESFRMVPLNFQKQSGVLPEILKVRFERLVPLSQDVHVATFDTTQSSVPGRQRGLQVRSTPLGAERGSTAQLEIPIDC